MRDSVALEEKGLVVMWLELQMTRICFRVNDNYVGVRSIYNYYGNEDLCMKNDVVHVHVYNHNNWIQ